MCLAVMPTRRRSNYESPPRHASGVQKPEKSVQYKQERAASFIPDDTKQAASRQAAPACHSATLPEH